MSQEIKCPQCGGNKVEKDRWKIQMYVLWDNVPTHS